MYGDGIGAFFDNCLACMYCSLADQSVYTKSCSIRYWQAVPVGRVLYWKSEVVGSDRAALKEQTSGRVTVRGSLVDYDQVEAVTGKVFAEAERTCFCRFGLK